ncbi:MAG: hypothetical protein LBR53_01045 [Deltaproteobacteria bacterium]|nr:hypothetical protein [Deltaproteobacteria bacterium]
MANYSFLRPLDPQREATLAEGAGGRDPEKERGGRKGERVKGEAGCLKPDSAFGDFPEAAGGMSAIGRDG